MVTKEELDKYIKAYQDGHTLISDEEYDVLLEEYLKEHPEAVRPFTRNKQSSAVNDIVGTLPKVYGLIKPMRDGQKTYKEIVEKRFSKHEMVHVQPKFDGTSIAYDFNQRRFFTRGDYDNGESVDVTELFEKHIPLIEQYMEKMDVRGPLVDIMHHASAIKFEAILAEEVYKRTQIKDQYKRARDFVAATITSRNVEAASLITLIPLRIYADHKMYLDARIGFGCECDDYEIMQEFIDEILTHGSTYKERHGLCPSHNCETFACDGIVISRDDESTPYDQVDEVNPELEIACKILNLVMSTTLKDIKWQFGVSGRITPVAIVEPVTFGNVVVTNVGLSTFERVYGMNLRYGDTVHIMYNIVPYFIDSENNGSTPIPLPQICPICQSKLDMSNLKQVRCTNPLCQGRKIGDIVRYVQKMKMFGVSEGTITRLFDLGYIKEISEMYTSDLTKAVNENGFGWRSIENLKRSIQMASTNIPVHRWLGALPCENVSDKKWRIILNSVYGLSNPEMNKEIYELCSRDTPDAFLQKMLQNTLQIGPATTVAIREGIIANWDNIRTIIPYIQFEEVQHAIPNKGKVCMSGTRDENTMTYLRQIGYEVTDSFTKDVIALVIPNPMFHSSKVDKAKANGIPIYTLNDIDNGALS
jgi:NAD-dependent DNA ligase